MLREHVKNTELGFFTEYFLPLAAACLDRFVEETDMNIVVWKSKILLHGRVLCPELT